MNKISRPLWATIQLIENFMPIFSQHYQEEIKKTFLLALPIVIAQLGVVLMGVTDNIIVGRYIGKLDLGRLELQILCRF